MKKYALIAVLTAALCLSSACSKSLSPQSGDQDSSVSETKPGKYVSSIVSLQDPFQIEHELDVYTALNQLLPSLGLEGKAEYNFKQDYTDRNSVRKFYRMKQQCNGVDIYGAGITFSVDKSGICDCYIDESVSTEMNDSNANLSVADAEQKIPDYLGGSELRSADYLNTVYYPYKDNSYHLSYSFYVNSVSEDQSGFSGIFFLDADTGELIGSELSEHAAETVVRESAELKDSNNKPLQYHVQQHANGEIEYSDEINRIYILDAGYKSLEDTVLRDGDNYTDDTDILFSNSTSRYYSAKSQKDDDNKFAKALEYTEKIYDYYSSKGLHGFYTHDNIKDPGHIYIVLNESSFSTLNSSAISVRRYPSDMNSALIKVSPICNLAVDILAHEYTHSVIYSKSKLKKDKGETEALNEAYADIMGIVIENDHTWTIGNLTKRDARKARKKGDSEWKDNGDAHDNCKVITHCACLIYGVFQACFGMSEDEAMTETGNLWYDSMSYLMDYDCSFEDCMYAVYQAGKDRGYSQELLDRIAFCFHGVNIGTDYSFPSISEPPEATTALETTVTSYNSQSAENHHNSELYPDEESSKISGSIEQHSSVFPLTQESAKKYAGVILTNGQRTVGLKTDGTVVASGDNRYGECEVSLWTDINAISAGNGYTIGLKYDGTVMTTNFPYPSGDNYGQCDVSGWRDIVAVSTGTNHTVGLKSDGTVIATGDNSYGQCDVSGWSDIIAVAAGNMYTLGLKSDGTVSATGYNEFYACEVSDWTNVTDVSAGKDSIGLKSDGTVVAAGSDYRHNRRAVSDWNDIVAVASGLVHTIGLKSDGTVVATGTNYYGQCDVSDWKDIVAISAGEYYTVGLKSDGTVVATKFLGEYYESQCNVSNWRDIVAVYTGKNFTIGLKADGTVVATGNNDSGQCDVSNWTNIGPTP